MLFTSEAIVLKKIKYAENSHIIHLFTLKHGHLSFLFSKGRGKQKKASVLLFPLTLVEISADYNPKKNIQHISSMALSLPFQSIPFNPFKSAIAQFLAEVYFECTRHEVENSSLYNFMTTSIEILDIIENNIHLYHLKNLLELSRQMGFYPSDNHSSTHPYFDLMNGVYRTSEANGCCNKSLSSQIYHLITLRDLETYKPEIKFNVSELLTVLISYFELHLTGFHKPKSMEVFRMLL